MQENKIRLQKTLAAIVKKHRNASKKSISLLSNEIMLAKSLWSDLESGKKDPQLSTLWRIAEALDIPLSAIIKELEEKMGRDFSFFDDKY